MIEHLDWVLGGILLLIAFFTGKIIENKHFSSLSAREASAPKIPIVNTKEKKMVFAPHVRTELVIGSVVLSSDFFRATLANILNIFGGRIGVFENLLDRARREALLRVQEKAKGATHLLNVRYETATLSNAQGRDISKIEVVVYATAVYS